MSYYSLILDSSGGLKFILLGTNWCFSDTWCESTVLPTWKSGELADITSLFWGIVSTGPSERRDIKSFGSWQVLSKLDTVGGRMLAGGRRVGDFYILDFKKKDQTLTLSSSLLDFMWLTVPYFPFKWNQKTSQFYMLMFPGFSFLRSYRVVWGSVLPCSKFSFVKIFFHPRKGNMERWKVDWQSHCLKRSQKPGKMEYTCNR